MEVTPPLLHLTLPRTSTAVLVFVGCPWMHTAPLQPNIAIATPGKKKNSRVIFSAKSPITKIIHYFNIYAGAYFGTSCE